MSGKADAAGNGTIILKNWHVIVTAVVIPAVSITAAIYSKDGAVKQMISVVEKNVVADIAKVDAKIAKVELNTERDFVKKEDFGELKTKLTKMAEDIAAIKGYMRSRLGRRSRSEN